MWFGLHDALLPLGEYPRIRDVLREVETLAQPIGDRQRLGRAYSYICHNAWIDLADNERAADYVARTLRIADAEGNRTLAMVVSFYLGQINLSRGDLPASVEMFSRCMALAAADSSPRPRGAPAPDCRSAGVPPPRSRSAAAPCEGGRHGGMVQQKPGSRTSCRGVAGWRGYVQAGRLSKGPLQGTWINQGPGFQAFRSAPWAVHAPRSSTRCRRSSFACSIRRVSRG